MPEFETIHEIAKAARRILGQGEWDYLTGGTETETTLKRNRAAIDTIALRPRVLRDVTGIETAATFLGRKTRLPVILAPMGSLEVLHADGAMAVAKAAERAGVVSMLSSVTEPGLEEVGAATGHPKVFQLYVRGGDDWVFDHVRRAIDAGFVGLCLTVDTAIYSRRERDIIKRYRPTARRSATGRDFQAALAWGLVDKIKAKFDLPLIVKGVATAEDAALCLEHGVDVVYVSNHGGRQLDHGRGAIEIVPEVVEAVGGRAEVVVDGGFLRGTDILKAIALGCTQVAVGKVQGLALAADGEEGIVRLLEILETEIAISMGLLGVTRLEELDRSFLHMNAAPMNPPAVFSGLPFFASDEQGY